MPTRIHATSPLVLAIFLAVTLLPAAALAQAGLTGNAMGPSADKFDQNFQNKSALGQLEEMTGTTVDRSSNQSSNQSTVTRVAPQPRLVQPRYDPNQQIAGAAAATIIGALFSNVFSDNSAQEQAAAEAAAEAAAAQAAAEAEAFRLQQEAARVARVRMAQHYRAEWDSREAEIGEQLGGAFDVTTGTALFGRPANPDADTVAAILSQDTGGASQGSGEAPDVPTPDDTSVVDLRGSSMVVQLLRQPVPVVSLRPRAPSAIGPSWPHRYDNWDDTDEPAQPSAEDPGLYAMMLKNVDPSLPFKVSVYAGATAKSGLVDVSETVNFSSGIKQTTVAVGEGLHRISWYRTSDGDLGACYAPAIPGGGTLEGYVCVGTDGANAGYGVSKGIITGGDNLQILNLKFGREEDEVPRDFNKWADHGDWFGGKSQGH